MSEYVVTKIKGDESMRVRSTRVEPSLYWVWQQFPPEVPAWTDGTEGEWFRINMLRSLSESVFGEAPVTQRVLDTVRHKHGLRPNQKVGPGVIITAPPKEREGSERAGFGERDREFRNLDLRAVQWEADGYDYTLGAEHTWESRRVTEFHDLVALMGEIPIETEAHVVWNRERDEDGFWNPARWTWATLAKRLCTYRWNDDFFVKRRIPERARCGVVHEGDFVYLGDSTYAYAIARWRPEGAERDVFTVFWRESVGWETTRTGKRVRAWVYHYAKTFTSFDGPSYLDRQGALAFADRLQAKAKLEAELLNDLRESMGESVQRNWDHNEYSYAPEWLPLLAGDHSWSDEH